MQSGRIRFDCMTVQARHVVDFRVVSPICPFWTSAQFLQKVECIKVFQSLNAFFSKQVYL